MKSLAEIKDILSSNKRNLFSKYKIKTLAIFGSYVRNDFNENSDLDLIVDFNENIGIEFIDLAEEIERLMGFKVDLVSKNGIKSKYYDSIKKEMIYV